MSRAWLCALVFALVAVAAAPAVVHADHDAHLDCEVCELVNESQADLADQRLHVRPTDTPDAAVDASAAALALSHHRAQTPARAPPPPAFRLP